MTTPELVLVITTTGGIVMQLAKEIRDGWGRQAAQAQRAELAEKTDRVSAKADQASDKLDEIHKLADGNLSRVTQELAEQRAVSQQALDRIVRLEELLQQSMPASGAPLPVKVINDPASPVPVIPATVTRKEGHSND